MSFLKKKKRNEEERVEVLLSATTIDTPRRKQIKEVVFSTHRQVQRNQDLSNLEKLIKKKREGRGRRGDGERTDEEKKRQKGKKR
jgi:hypothetical protein